MSTGLGREDIRALLDDLSAELAERGARAELFLVGGAALAVAYDATRATRDLDAVFIPTDTVRQAATAVAQHRGLTEDWLKHPGLLEAPQPGEDGAMSNPRYPAEMRERAVKMVLEVRRESGRCSSAAARAGGRAAQRASLRGSAA